jgi:LPXTG-site transpeptidase (sortase) family protein
MKLVASLLIIVGISFLGLGLYLLWDRNNPNRLAFTNYQYSDSEQKQIKENNLPTQVVIPDIAVDVEVIPAMLQGNNWQITDKGASYLTSTPIPGETGNSVMYAHNWGGLFQNLYKIKPGNKVTVTYADKTTKTFSVAYTLEVSPGDISVLSKSTDKRLTLYTCSGLLDSKRFVAVALLKE